ncbi:hypothetical protein KFE26_23195 [Shewanella sp. M16]|uniref:hypothetical protein n=1 Tax=Shewanella TaxID=22 RepID=UPI001BB01667|nr:hypothetical protein [Shewanella sp. M16]MBS0045156.1 hypothetical protein [Shewanella sp. M16]
MRKLKYSSLDNLMKYLQEEGFTLDYLSQLSEIGLYQLANKKSEVSRKVSPEAQEELNQRIKHAEEEKKQRNREISLQEASKYEHLGGIYRISASLTKQGLK